VAEQQGDLIGRIFAPWVIVYFRQFLKITKVAHILKLLFPWLKLFINFDKKGWATFWAFFSQTHLVTLPNNVLGEETGRILSD
jgi:hypothetical protein